MLIKEDKYNTIYRRISYYRTWKEACSIKRYNYISTIEKRYNFQWRKYKKISNYYNEYKNRLSYYKDSYECIHDYD